MPTHYSPKVGAYAWKQKLTDLLISERSEIERIMALMKQARNSDTMLTLGEMQAEKTRRIATLYELLNMRDEG